mmetsp:Transcript_806/g.1690  ORF Transcript_806/g.1690 Transcript_806/m.1690 type:complete len:240 (+) Transcript_806:74-793(+)
MQTCKQALRHQVRWTLFGLSPKVSQRDASTNRDGRSSEELIRRRVIQESVKLHQRFSGVPAVLALPSLGSGNSKTSGASFHAAIPASALLSNSNTGLSSHGTNNVLAISISVEVSITVGSSVLVAFVRVVEVRVGVTVRVGVSATVVVASGGVNLDARHVAIRLGSTAISLSKGTSSTNGVRSLDLVGGKGRSSTCGSSGGGSIVTLVMPGVSIGHGSVSFTTDRSTVAIPPVIEELSS